MICFKDNYECKHLCIPKILNSRQWHLHSSMLHQVITYISYWNHLSWLKCTEQVYCCGLLVQNFGFRIKFPLFLVNKNYLQSIFTISTLISTVSNSNEQYSVTITIKFCRRLTAVYAATDRAFKYMRAPTARNRQARSGMLGEISIAGQ